MILKKLDDSFQMLAGDLTRLREVLHPKNDPLDLPYSLAYATLEAGTASLPHRLSGTEVYHIVKGEGVAFVGQDQWPVGPGDTFVVAPDTLQYVKNTGTTRLEFLCIVSPPWSPEGEVILLDG
jgi:mannose-6-phosphate isomerase-like protein (cupin superfamily)